MARLSEIWTCAVTGGVPRCSLCTALAVGSVLNLINQGDVLFGTDPFVLRKLLLTYCVPFCVATFGAVSYRLSERRAGRQHASAVGDRPAP